MQRGGASTMIPVNPFDRRARPDPYPVYQYMRTVDPVYQSPVGFWILTRYEDCRAVLEDPRWSHDADRLLEPNRGPADPVDPLVRLVRASIGFSDSTSHARHRKVLEAAVKPAVRTVAAQAARIADRLTDLMMENEGGNVELMSAYAAPLPLTVLGDVIGLPAADRAQIHHWGREVASGLDPGVRSAGVIRGGSAAMALVEYMQNRLDEARSGSRGLLSAIAASSPSLSTWESVADLIVFLVVGVEASCSLIGNAMLALIRHPDQLAELRRRPSLMDAALEELIRFDGPIHLTARVANEDIMVGKSTIRTGEQALVMLGAANRDPARFRDPDQLDLTRDDNPHLGFGA
ncbi:MAG TPA: cytochrome P450, partial [Candidatus Dormibacteraeota bacterium]|nr:cytochrome P450 [Candidatus Dormibacteraeota bacterium]